MHEAAPYHDGSFQRWAKTASREYPFHYLDGVTIRLAETDEHPGDDFLTSASAQPDPGYRTSLQTMTPTDPSAQ